MTKEEFLGILEKHLEGTATNTERKLLDDFHTSCLEKRRDYWNEWNLSEKQRIKEELFQSLNKAIDEDISAVKKVGRQPGLVWKIAASITAFLGVAVWLYSLPNSGPEIKYIVKSTTKGQKATITLTDGSTVRLNAESSIKYSEPFSEDIRKVELNGEAFFDVKKDKDRPFLVTSHNIQTTALGTSFNIHAYSPSLVSVALVTGRVMVMPIAKKPAFNTSEVYLNPGEGALYDGISGNISVGPYDAKKLTAWKDGIIYLADAGCEQVFGQLARWYGVEFQFTNKPTEKWQVSGEFKDMSLELVLNTIGHAKGFEFHILTDVVTVKFKN